MIDATGVVVMPGATAICIFSFAAHIMLMSVSKFSKKGAELQEKQSLSLSCRGAGLRNCGTSRFCNKLRAGRYSRSLYGATYHPAFGFLCLSIAACEARSLSLKRLVPR